MNTPTPITPRPATPIALRPKRLLLISPPQPLPQTTTLANATAAGPRRNAHQEIYASTANAITLVHNYHDTVSAALTAEVRAQIGQADAAKVQAFLDAAKVFVNTLLPGTIA